MELQSVSGSCKKKKVTEYVFLARLDKAFDEVRSRLLDRKTLPSLRETYLEMRRKENRRRVILQPESRVPRAIVYVMFPDNNLYISSYWKHG